MKRLIFLLLVFSGFYVSGQKMIRGKVVCQTADVTGVSIQNLGNERATITDFSGNFSIMAREGDTLVFSAVQLKKKTIIVTNAIYASPFVQIPMEEFVNELKEVTVKPFGLSGDVTKDVANLKLDKDVSAEALGLPNAYRKIPTQNERKLQEASKGMYSLRAPLAVNINPIINAITGRTKMLKNRVAIDKKYARTQNVQKSVEDSLFITALKIPKEKIEDFMYFCEVDEEFQGLVALNDQLKLWEYLLKRSETYRKNNDLQKY